MQSGLYITYVYDLSKPVFECAATVFIFAPFQCSVANLELYCRQSMIVTYTQISSEQGSFQDFSLEVVYTIE